MKILRLVILAIGVILTGCSKESNIIKDNIPKTVQKSVDINDGAGSIENNSYPEEDENLPQGETEEISPESYIPINEEFIRGQWLDVRIKKLSDLWNYKEDGTLERISASVYEDVKISSYSVFHEFMEYDSNGLKIFNSVYNEYNDEFGDIEVEIERINEDFLIYTNKSGSVDYSVNLFRLDSALAAKILSQTKAEMFRDQWVNLDNVEREKLLSDILSGLKKEKPMIKQDIGYYKNFIDELYYIKNRNSTIPFHQLLGVAILYGNAEADGVIEN